MKFLLQHLKQSLFFASDVLAVVYLSLFKSPQVSKKILIIRIDALGDFILFTPCISAYRKLYSNYHMTILVSGNTSQIAKRFSEFDEVIAVDKNKFRSNIFYRWNIFNIISAAGFEIVIYPTYSRESLGDSIVKVSKATKRIGQVGNTDNIPQWQKNITDRFYTKLIPIEGSPLTEIERNRKFVESLGAVIHSSLPSLGVSGTEVATAQRFLISRGLKNKPYAVINPGSQAPFKRWPLKCFAEVIDYLHTHYGLEIVLTGIPSERYLGENIQKMTRVKVIDTIGWTSFVELSAILKKSILYVGNDTGTVHIAAAVGTPTVCIMGGGHFGWCPR
jgi:ADP-heptose:LPS heptosyltransferase